MSIWAITGKGTFAALELAALRRIRVSQCVDEVSFDAPGAAFDGEALFEYGETITITKDGAVWFVGRCNTIPRQGDPAEERISYEFLGAWWYFEKCVYQQKWMMWNAAKVPDPGLDNLYKSRVILCQDEDGEPITSGEQIAAAVDYAIEKGAPINRGLIEPDINLPWDECVDITVAEVINRLLKWTPDVACWFDYSTNPPTFHCRKRVNLTPVSFDVNAGAPNHRISISPRYDLQIPGVIVRFEQSNEVDGETYESVITQTAGDINSLETLITTIELGGYKMSWMKQKIVTEAFPDPLTDPTWWQLKVPWLADSRVSFTVTLAERAGTLPRILTEGQIQEWMTDVDSENDVVTGKIDYTFDDVDEETISEVNNLVETVQLVATDAETKTYKKLAEFTSGEAIPAGVAASLYASWSQLQWDGQFVLLEQECSGNVYPGQALNLTGGLEAWETMSALVTRVEEDVDNGLTTIVFGPNRRIAPEDLVSLLRGFRTRRTSASYQKRISGKTEDGSPNVSLSGPSEKNNGTGGAGETKKLTLKDKGTTYTKKIDNDPSLISKADADVTIQPRELELCFGDVVKHIQVMCSEPY